MSNHLPNQKPHPEIILYSPSEQIKVATTAEKHLRAGMPVVYKLTESIGVIVDVDPDTGEGSYAVKDYSRA